MLNYFINNLLFANGVQAETICPPPPKTELVFMYGTLKKGEPNHHILKNPKNGTAKFWNKGKTEKKYPMVIATKFNMPFLLDAPGKGCHVDGEVYEVSERMLGKLDVLKDHPKLYEREQENIIMKNPKTNVIEPITCWVYFLKIVTPELLAKKCIGDYSTKGDHGLPYISNTTATKLTKDDLVMDEEKK